jgi:hypothetical protein
MLQENENAYSQEIIVWHDQSKVESNVMTNY